MALFPIEFIEISPSQEKARSLWQKYKIRLYMMLINMTQDEFFDRLKECFAEACFAPEPSEGVKIKKHYVYGLQGICDLYGCSKSTASRIKQSGLIDPAISQIGNIIVVDADLALDLLKPNKHNRSGKK